MISSNISDIENIVNASFSVENRLNNLFRGLNADYEEFIKGNVFYKKVSIVNIVLSIIIDIVLIFVLFQNTKIAMFIQRHISYSGYRFNQIGSKNALSSIIFWILFAICVYSIYKTGVKIYCKKIERYSKRISNAKHKATKALENLKNQQLSSQMLKAILNDEEFTIDSRNDLGDEIISIREGFMTTNQKAHNVKRAIQFGVTGILYALFIIFTLTKLRNSAEISNNYGLTVALMNIVAIIIIGISQINLGEFLGKYTKMIGCLAAMIYSGLLYFSIRKVFAIPFIKIEGSTQPYNKACIIIPLLQFVSIILAVCLSHYGILKEKIEQGFEVPMKYGDNKPKGTKGMLFSCIAVASVGAVLIFVIVARKPISGLWDILIFTFLWYLTNCLVKPRGSYLYAYWGPGRSIANELVMISAVISSAICSRGTLSIREILCMCIGVVGSFIIGGIATFINNL